ncbi:MAG: hypothetical protein Q9188_003201 [Gyalolechia gomerana]
MSSYDINDHEPDTSWQTWGDRKVRGRFSPTQAVGEPSSKTVESWPDFGAIVIVTLALIVAIVVVWNQATAITLGQTNQLIIVGAAPTVMSLCAQRQILLAAIAIEVRFGQSKLTSFDALLRNSLLSPRIGMFARHVLLVLIILPLSLSVAYKRLSGGFSTKFAYLGDSIGGLLVAQASHRVATDYKVASNTTAALPDTPEWETIWNLSHTLRLGQSVTFNTTVDATVAEYKEIQASERDDPRFWADLEARGFVNKTIDMGYNLCSQITATGSKNYTKILLSIWDLTNETFSSTAQRFVQTRRLCQGTCSLSAANVTLIEAQLLHQTDDHLVIQEMGGLNLGRWFTVLLPEYNYSWYPPENPHQVNTFPPLVASILWARIVSHNGHQNVNRADQDRQHAERTFYTKSGRQVHMRRRFLTLQRSRWLLVVMSIHLVPVMLATFVKASLLIVPVGDNSGLILLLSGVKRDCLQILYGAGLSGTLRGDVRVRIEVVLETENADSRRIPCSALYAPAIVD